ncbi:hypothetical protein DSECCO2_532890 [anaerobic digester metagenome]
MPAVIVSVPGKMGIEVEAGIFKMLVKIGGRPVNTGVAVEPEQKVAAFVKHGVGVEPGSHAFNFPEPVPGIQVGPDVFFFFVFTITFVGVHIGPANEVEVSYPPAVRETCAGIEGLRIPPGNFTAPGIPVDSAVKRERCFGLFAGVGGADIDHPVQRG